MDATIKKEAALQGRPFNQSPLNHTTLLGRIKHGVITLALWRVISYRTATAIMRALGVSHA